MTKAWFQLLFGIISNNHSVVSATQSTYSRNFVTKWQPRELDQNPRDARMDPLQLHKPTLKPNLWSVELSKAIPMLQNTYTIT